MLDAVDLHAGRVVGVAQLHLVVLVGDAVDVVVEVPVIEAVAQRVLGAGIESHLQLPPVADPVAVEVFDADVVRVLVGGDLGVDVVEQGEDL